MQLTAYTQHAIHALIQHTEKKILNVGPFLSLLPKLSI